MFPTEFPIPGPKFTGLRPMFENTKIGHQPNRPCHSSQNCCSFMALIHKHQTVKQAAKTTTEIIKTMPKAKKARVTVKFSFAAKPVIFTSKQTFFILVFAHVFK